MRKEFGSERIQNCKKKHFYTLVILYLKFFNFLHVFQSCFEFLSRFSKTFRESFMLKLSLSYSTLIKLFERRILSLAPISSVEVLPISWRNVLFFFLHAWKMFNFTAIPMQNIFSHIIKRILAPSSAC